MNSNTEHTRNWLKPLLGSAVAVAAFTLVAASIAPGAMAVDAPTGTSSETSKSAKTAVSTRSFPATTATGKAVNTNGKTVEDPAASDDAAANDANSAQADGSASTPSPAAAPQAATANTLTVKAYTADADGTISKNPVKDGDAFNAKVKTLHFDIALTTDQGYNNLFPTDSFDKNDKYNGAKKDRVAFNLKVTQGFGTDQPADTVVPVKYGDFTQIKDRRGNVTGYEIKPADISVTLTELNGPIAFAVERPVDTTTQLPTDDSLPVNDTLQFTNTLPAGDITYDIVYPAKPTSASFGTGWVQQKVDNTTVRLSDGAGIITIKTDAALNGDSIALVNIADKNAVLASGNPVDDTFTWTPTESDTYKVSDLAVETSDKAGNTVTTPLVDLFTDDTDKTSLIVVDNSTGIGYDVTIGGNKGNAKLDGFYKSVDSFTVKPKNNFNATTLKWRLEVLKARGEKLFTLTKDGTSVDNIPDFTVNGSGKNLSASVDLSSLKLDDGKYQWKLNTLLPTVSGAFSIDSTKPVIDSASYAGDTGNDITNTKTGEVIAFPDANKQGNPERTVKFEVTESGSGLDENGVEIAGNFTDANGKSSALTNGKDYAVAVTGPQNGKYTVAVTFKTPGTYDFSKITIAVTDKIGNPDTKTPENITTLTKDKPSKLVLFGNNMMKNVKTTLEVVAGDADNTYTANGSDTIWHSVKPKEVRANITGNPYAEQIAAALQSQDALKTTNAVSETFNDDSTATKYATVANLTVKADDKDSTKAVVTWTDPQATADGKYQFALNALDAQSPLSRLFGITNQPSSVTFGIDTNKPKLVSVTTESGQAITANTEYNGKEIFAATGDQKLKVTVKDYRKDTTETNFTSGIKSVVIKVKKADDLTAQAKDVKADVQQVSNDNGVYTGIVTLAQEGYYDLDSITVSATDNVKNASDPESATSVAGGVEAIVAINPNAAATTAITLNDVSGKKAGPHTGYFRGEVEATYTVDDKWFPLSQNAKGNKDGVKTTDLLADSQFNGQNSFMKLTAGDNGWSQKKNTYQWSITKKVRTRGDSKLQEGTYFLQFKYQGFLNKMSNVAQPDKVIDGTANFVIDWTKPSLGAITLNPDQKVWKSLLFTESETVTLNGIGDNLTGIDNGTKAFATTDSNDDINSKGEVVSYDAHISGATLGNGDLTDPSSGSMSFTMSADSFRLNAEGTSLAVCDMAGNCASTGSFSEKAPFKGEIEKIVIDNVAPTMNVSYDNNDVRNGKYYKAHRTGTVTIVESNLDLIQARDDDRVVVTTSVDGKQSTVALKDFKAASADGKTYSTQFKADSDGDWVVNASFADPLHATATFHDEFTVDTVAPKLTLTFDNNNVKNGKYYAADRNATIREVERNFSKDESVITVTAKDDNGANTAAPGPAGWQRTGGTRESTEWTNSVAFTSEAHFTIKATATDLAGNKAEEVSEPEFVIDKTKPQIKINRVEDKTAYAGTVAPLIDFSDVNIDMKNVSYTLVGDHRGALKGDKMPKNVTTDTANDRTVDFTDFERKVDFDDVYTIKAHGTDLAGNTFETKKTFSVNRFGSTYTFDADTTNLRGTYLKKAQDVQITEINVSGLDLSKRQIVIAKDDKATTLTNNDYKVATSDDKGWSRTVYTVPASRFTSDGFYRVQVQSMDEAGNLSQNTMDKKNADRKGTAEVNFAVDSTAPTASLLGIKSGTVYYSQQGQPASVDAKDNLGIKSTEVYVDGQLKDSWKGDATLKSTPSLKFDADAKSHEIVIHTIDMAGNEATSTYDNIYVASNWWQYATHTPWLRNTMIFGALVVLAAIAGVIVAVNQRRKQSAYRKNLFDR